MRRRHLVPTFHKFRQDLGDFDERPRPSMQKQKRYRLFSFTLSMHKMNIIDPETIHVHRSCELRLFIKLRFSFAPFILVCPVLRQSLDIAGWWTVEPWLTVVAIGWYVCESELLLYAEQFFFGDCTFGWGKRCHVEAMAERYLTVSCVVWRTSRR